MGVFAYRGIDSAGRNVKGVRDADSPRALRAVLKRDGVMVTEVLEQAEAAKKSAREIDFKRLLRRVTPMDLAVTTKQLAVLLRSGIPLVEGLTALIEQVEKPELRTAFTDARDKVNEGISFAEALKAHPKYFSGLYVSMISAGEASGTLEVVLDRLADFLDSQANLRSKVSGALAYPLVMLVICILVIILMMTVVVPKVTNIFADFGASLPWYTEMLVWMSETVTGYWWLLSALIAGGVYGFRRWRATPEGTAKWDQFLLRMPVFGDLIVKVAVARFSRTLATLLQSGVPILVALDITRNVLGNSTLMKVIDDARNSVREGEGLAKPLKASKRFPPIVTHMIAIGERSGAMEEMLENVARAYDREVDIRVQSMTKLLEPLIIVFMGGTIAFIAASILMPLLQMNEFVG